MKPFISTSITILLLVLTTKIQAQFSIGPGIVYGTEVNEIGLQIRGVNSFSDQWRGEADIIYYLDGIKDLSFWEINLNAQFVFTNSEKFDAYALAGFNFLLLSESIFGEPSTSSEVGLNLGVGGQYPISEKISALAEFKYTISDFDQLVIGLGIQFRLSD